MLGHKVDVLRVRANANANANANPNPNPYPNPNPNPSSHVLRHEVDVLGLLDHLQQMDDVRVADVLEDLLGLGLGLA